MISPLDYQPLEPPRDWNWIVAPVAGMTFVVVAIAVLTQTIPHSMIWYFGPHNESWISIENLQLNYRSEGVEKSLGHVPVTAAFGLLVGIPAWLLDKLVSRLFRLKSSRPS